MPEIIDSGASLFTAATAPAYLKAAIMGFSGSGKTFTAGRLVRGLWHTLVEKKIITPDMPVFFIESERGSQFEKARFDREKISLQVAPVRTYSDLLRSLEYIAKIQGIGIIDSVSWYWREFCEAYAEKKGRKNGLRFDDWSFLKGSQGWGKFTDLFVNSPCHLCMCGRAGYEYDMQLNDATGKNEIQKSGIKMRAEGETAYEPDLLILMEQRQEENRDEKDGEGKPVKDTYHLATVFKDRGNDLEHQSFRNPTYETFKVHIDRLNLGGPHVALRTTNRTQDMIPADKSASFKRNRERIEIVLDEIKALMTKFFPSRSDADKKLASDLQEKHFGTRSWKKIETLDLDALENGRNAIWQDLEGVPYTFGQKPVAGSLAEQIGDLLDRPATGPVETEDDRRKCTPTADKPVIKRDEPAVQEPVKAPEAVKAPEPEKSPEVTQKAPAAAEAPPKAAEVPAKKAEPEPAKAQVKKPPEPEKPAPIASPVAKSAADDEPTQEDEDKAAIAMLERQITEATDVAGLGEMLKRLQLAGEKKLLPDKEVKRLLSLGSARKEALTKKRDGALF